MYRLSFRRAKQMLRRPRAADVCLVEVAYFDKLDHRRAKISELLWQYIRRNLHNEPVAVGSAIRKWMAIAPTTAKTSRRIVKLLSYTTPIPLRWEVIKGLIYNLPHYWPHGKIIDAMDSPVCMRVARFWSLIR